MPISSVVAQDPKNTERRVVYWTPSGKSPKFLCDCPTPTRAELNKIAVIMRLYWLERGEFPRNPEKYKPLGNGLYEVKASSQLRLIGIYANGRTDFVIVLCVRKKKNKLDPADIGKALRLVDQYEKEQSAAVKKT